MPKVKKIIYNGSRIPIGLPPEELVNADNPSDISGEQFTAKDKAPTANALRILKQHVDSAIIPEGALTFDTTPTIGSDKPVTSEGIYRFVLQAIDDYFNNKFVVLTQEEYDNLQVYDPNRFYMIIEPDITEEDDNQG